MSTNNLIKNSSFNQQLKRNFGQTNYTHADKGWFTAKKSKWNSDTLNNNSLLFADNKGAGSLTQVITSNSVSKGLHYLNFDATNLGSNNILRIQVYGINGQFELDNWRPTSPTSATGSSIKVKTLLDTKNLATSEFKDQNINKQIDFGNGYEYIAVRVFTDGVSSSETMTIDNFTLQTAPVVADLSIKDIAVNEDEATAVVTVKLSTAVSSDVTVNYNTVKDTAIAGEDFRGKKGILTIPAGGTQGQITIDLINDTKKEFNEQFWVNLSDAVNANIKDSVGIVTISDEDAKVNLSPTVAIIDPEFEAGVGIRQNFGKTYSRDHGKGWIAPKKRSWRKKWGAEIAVADDDGAEGMTQVIKNDKAAQGLQSINFDAMHNGSNNVLRLQVFGVNGEFKFSNWNTNAPVSTTSQPLEMEKLLDTGNVTKGNFSWKTFSQQVDFGSGYEYIAIRFFTDGVDPSDDELLAIDNVFIGNDNNNPAPPAPTPGTPDLSLDDVIVDENKGTATLTVNLSSATTSDVSVNYDTVSDTAIAGEDFRGSKGILTIPAGSTQGQITVDIIDDSSAENEERFKVQLSNPSNANIADGNAIVTISANDSTVNPPTKTQALTIIDPQFDSASGFVRNFGRTFSSDHGKGWMVPQKAKWKKDFSAELALADDDGAEGLTQVIKNDNGAKGLQYISFDATHFGTGNDLRLEVFGINGDFVLNNNGTDAPSLTSSNGRIKTLWDTGNIADQEFSWTRFQQQVDFGNGYEYIAVRFYTDGVSSDEFMKIDNFSITDNQAQIPLNLNNNLPVATNDSFHTTQDNAIVIDVLSNDYDPDGDAFTIKDFTQPANGEVTLKSNGTLLYTPEPGLLGQNNFTYTVVDQNGLENMAQVEVTVNSPTFDLGTNLQGVSYFSPQHPFLDIFKTARKWIPQNKNTFDTGESSKLDLDAHGWVKSLPGANDTSVAYDYVSTSMSVDPNSAGRYVVLYDGEGTLQYRGSASLVSSNPSQGFDVIDVDASSKNVRLSIIETDPNNNGEYLHNIRIVPEESADTYQQDMFNPDFLNHIKNFGTLRFMDWMDTNFSQESSWQERTQVDDYTYFNNGGTPVEVMVELANRTGTDPWFTLPHKADDQYVANFAQYVKDNLDPDLEVYVEYSNEVWNYNFSQSKWVTNQGAAEGLTREQWYSKRTTEVIGIWDDVFGNQKDRVLGVMAAQAGNSAVGRNVFDYAAWDSQPSTSKQYGVDVLAIAPYFGNYIGQKSNNTVLLDWIEQEPDGGLDKLFDELLVGDTDLPNSQSGGAVQQAFDRIYKYASLAEREGLTLVAYEGGQHLVSANRNGKITNLFSRANNDPRMGDIYKQYLTEWFRVGGGDFVHFNDVRPNDQYGNWGLTEVLNQSSPKFDAVNNLANTSTNF